MKKEEIIRTMSESGFIKHNNISIVEIGENCAILKAELTDKSLNPYKIAHGGLIFGLGDTSMGVVARINGRSAVTQSSTISYLRPSTGQYLLAKAEMIKDGKTTCYLRTNIYDDKDILVATMDANYFYIN